MKFTTFRNTVMVILISIIATIAMGCNTAKCLTFGAAELFLVLTLCLNAKTGRLLAFAALACTLHAQSVTFTGKITFNGTFTVTPATPVVAQQAGVINTVQSVYVNPTNSVATPTTNLEASGAYSAFTSPVAASPYQQIAGGDGIIVYLREAGYNGLAHPIVVADSLDTFTGGSGSTIIYDLASRPDAIVTIQRDTSNSQITLQVWNGDGSNYSGLITLPYTTAGSESHLTYLGTGGGSNTYSVNQLYMKEWSTLSIPGTLPTARGTGDIVDISFAGTVAENSPNHYSLVQGSTPITFAGATAYAPYNSLTSSTLTGTTASIGGTNTAPLDGGTISSYAWTQVSGPTTATISGANTIAPTLGNLAFGDYKLQLTVTTSKGLVTTSTQDYGWVPTNASGFTIYPTALQSFFGKSLPLGSSLNQWPYYDATNQLTATWFAGLQSSSCSLAPDGCYYPYWNTPGVGTISGTSGSNTLSFTGVNPAATWCAGGTAPSQNSAIVIYTNSGANQYPAGVAGCTSTTLTLAYSLPFAVASGTQYGYMDNTMLTNMGGQSSNANYYDNVAAFYNLYYRSGLTKYQTAARYLADYWWNGPYIDKGNFTNDVNGNRVLHPRQISFAGLVLRALDGQSGYWTGLENIANYYANYGMNSGTLQTTGNPLSDTRETSYSGSFSALVAMFDPTSAKASAALTTANNIFTNVFEPARNSALGSSYPQLSNGDAPWNGSPGTCNVTNGSSTVQGVGTAWTGTETTAATNSIFWSTTQSIPTSNSYGDSVGYGVSSINAATQVMTLASVYTGSTATGKYCQLNNLVGIGNQPYMLGITYQFFRLLYLTGGATSPSTVLNRMAGITTYLTSTSGAYTGSSEYGLWYGRMNPNCEPNPVNCSGNNAEQSRYLTGEILAALADNYSRTLAASDLTLGNTLFGAMWSGPANGYSGPLVGAPSAVVDGNYVFDVKPPYGSGTVAKLLGFHYGFSLGPWWPAQSLVPHI